MKNIHVIPTEKPSRLWMTKLGNLARCHDTQFIKKSLGNNINIYITSDEEIKEGDWCLMFNDFGDRYVVQVTQVLKNNEFEVKLNSSPFNLNTSTRNKLKKIILTTDQDLIKDGVQSIDDTFLDWFVKNPSCEFVKIIDDVECLPMPNIHIHKHIYKIIIPQEKSKQETIEEAAERYAKSFIEDDGTIEVDFIEGGKWMAENIIEELEMHILVNEDDWSRNPQVQFKKFAEKFKKK